MKEKWDVMILVPANSCNLMSSFDGTNEAVFREGQADNGQCYFTGF